jgi:hypothetical protein
VIVELAVRPRDLTGTILEESYMDQKLAIVLNEGLVAWQALNVAGHLALAIGRRADPDVMGRHPLVDGSGVQHMGICKYPVITLRAATEDIRRIVRAARCHGGLLFADFPREMLDTYTDHDLAAALAATSEPTLEYLGVAILGSTGEVKRLTGAAALWK